MDYESYEFIQNSKKPYLVFESSPFRSFSSEIRKANPLNWFRLGWYDFRWTQALYGNENSPSDRWKKFEKATGATFKDWHSPGDYIIIMGQKEGDSAVLAMYDKYECFWDWVVETVEKIREYTDKPILIRVHPKQNKKNPYLMGWPKSIKDTYPKWKNVFYSDNVASNADYRKQLHPSGLYEDFKRAHCVITYSSNSAIESLMEGVPTYTLGDASMAWPVGLKDLSIIENLPYDIDLTQWKNDLAYTQWTNEEHKAGESWAHLKELVF